MAKPSSPSLPGPFTSRAQATANPRRVELPRAIRGQGPLLLLRGARPDEAPPLPGSLTPRAQDRVVRSPTAEFTLDPGPPETAALEGPSAGTTSATVSNAEEPGQR
jgi:hypothetical protein